MTDVYKTLILYIFLFVIRLVAILLFWPALTRMGYNLPIKNVVLMAYSGLRGAVSLCLALIVAQRNIEDNVSNLIMFHTCGVVFLTLLINATTATWLI